MATRPEYFMVLQHKTFNLTNTKHDNNLELLLARYKTEYSKRYTLKRVVKRVQVELDRNEHKLVMDALNDQNN
jgi:hypothetical protein